MATGYLRGALETTAVGNETNSPTLSTKKVFFPVQSFAPKLGPTPLDRDDELRNFDQSVASLTGEYDPEFEYESRMYPDLLGFWLCAALGRTTNYVTTAGNGVITDPDGTVIPTGAQRHVWTAPFGPSGVNPLSAQIDVAYKDQGQFYKLKGAAVKEFAWGSEGNQGNSLQISGPACYMDDQADPSLTPAYEALTVRPFRRGNFSIPTWLSGTGSNENVSINIARAVEAVRSFSIGSRWPDTMEYSNDPNSTLVTGTIEKRFLDHEDWLALRDLTGFAATMKWSSDSIIASSYPYKLYVQMSNCQYIDGDPEALGNKRRHGASYSFKSTSADGTTAATTVSLINATASYA